MNKPRISYLNISPYSRHSPTLQLKTDLKKQSNSLERPKSGKISYAGATTRGHTPVNHHDITERKYSPHVERKSELMTSLYQLAKSKQKEKTNTSKIQKAKDAPVKKATKSTTKLSEKMGEKLAIYQYLQNRSLKRSEESKILHPSASMQHTPSRQGSKSQLQDEKDYSRERKLLEASIIQQRQFAEALEEMHRAKGKPNSYSQNQQTLALLLKSAQRSTQANTGRVMQANNASMNAASVNMGYEDRKKMADPKRNELFKGLKLEADEHSVQKGRVVKPVEQEIVQKRHRRGLSTGQNPLCIDQFILEQEREREMERQRQLELEREREIERQRQLERERERERERAKQIEQQQYVMRDPQQEEDEFFEEFFHMDKMTFDFEKMMVSQKVKPDFYTPSVSPMQNRQQPMTYSRTKSIEEHHASLLPTKSTSRWTTKRSSMGDCARENFNMIEHISDFDRNEHDRNGARRYY